MKTPTDIKHQLHQSLSDLPKFSHCILLDHPDNRNAGDHYIWLGNVLYIAEVMKARITYASALSDFDQSQFQKIVKPGDPILLNGGGNFGDTWSRHQKFREFIIQTYPEHPVILLPQTIYFNNSENLKKTVDLINKHPNLKIFARDNVSYEIAVEHFKCQVFKSPDTAFQLVGSLTSSSFLKASASKNKDRSEKKILYLSRTDKEKTLDISSFLKPINNLFTEDWYSFKQKVSFQDFLSYDYQDSLRDLGALDYLKILRRIAKEIQSNGVSVANYWLSYFGWLNFHPLVNILTQQEDTAIHKRAWSFLHSGIQQLTQYDAVITDRLHGHILCTILEIPHIFLPNFYHKNKSFYDSWTSQICFCRFVEDPANIASTLDELLH